MDKRPYFFNRAALETGDKNFPSKYFCFYIISPGKMYIFLTSSNWNRDTAAGLLGGAIGATAFSVFKAIKDKRIKTKEIGDYEVLKELPEELVKKIPKFNKVVVISKQSVSKLRLSGYSDLAIFLKDGKWIRLNVGIPKREQMRDYLIKTNWIKIL